ncbi:MAG: lipoyl synthase [Halobacteria archaeon]|nr:lipoyl synthase [Halobacteria archaeon]
MPPNSRKPDWLRQRWNPDRQEFEGIKSKLREKGLVTVCEEASCPNIDECWSDEGTATFMILGDTCTRSCGFCDVKTGEGDSLDPTEPQRVAEAVEEIGLDYAVITSVDRDDLPDSGASQFAETVRRVRQTGALVETLIPDFGGSTDDLRKVIDEKPTVLAHNVETVERLQEKVRDPRAGYGQSLDVLRKAKEIDETREIFTKSSLMLGVGETDDEVLGTMDDLLDAGVDILTLGQYLSPSDDHIEIEEYVPPERFDYYAEVAEEKGFRFVASGPFVRSSYRAGELFVSNTVNGDSDADTQPRSIS